MIKKDLFRRNIRYNADGSIRSDINMYRLFSDKGVYIRNKITGNLFKAICVGEKLINNFEESDKPIKEVTE